MPINSVGNSVVDSTALAALAVPENIEPGTFIFNLDVDSLFVYTLSTASLVPDEVVAVAGVVGARWIIYVVADADHATTADSATTAAGPTNATTFTATLDVAIQPRSLKCSKFILPPATLTGDHALTVGNTSGVVGDLVQVVLRDLTAHTYTIKDQAGVDMFAWVGSTAGQAMMVQFYLSGSGWIFNTAVWCD